MPTARPLLGSRFALPSAEEMAATTSRSASCGVPFQLVTSSMMFRCMGMLSLLAVSRFNAPARGSLPACNANPASAAGEADLIEDGAAQQAVGVAQSLRQIEVAVI